MADESVKLTQEEQKYFDTRGDEAPKIEEKAEQSVEEPKEAPKLDAPKLEKQAKGTLKAKKPEVKAEAPEPEAEETPKPKDPKEEQIENLNAALREERAAAKERERRTEVRLQQLQDALIKPQQPVQEDVMPDPDKDAMGALKFLLKKQQEVGQFTAQNKEERERTQAAQRIMGESARLENEYLKQQPDYDAEKGISPTYNEASVYLLNMRRAELQATGAYNPMQIQNIVTQEAISLAAQALQNGKNPAEVVMNVAKARGFAPKPKEVTPAETEEQKLARIAKGQEQGFSLGQATGSKAPGNSKLDAKTLASMSDEDFTAFMEKAKKSDLRAMMGD